ncbi:NAD-dependent protein deacetylase [Pseudoduganella plicata]|uniref:protein acetyllysine N-acetyltransferase n=1 Tax=Pseudoduganella plicata TaxID=321984 RepID=A0A4P7BE17_9BURK|nr:NAD-dependent protein deacetylase [Pseudoduganella plicata]QBQ35549.1 NAD-dependent protein deacetylase [Pseudoduganella plicata]GGY96993.1 NAD-dependent protein deacetylase [Pseudoduganella plicata]
MTSTTPAATPEHTLESLADFLDTHRRVLVLTGAGLSTASGIPGYRDAEGIRRGRPPTEGPEFRRSDALRRRYWARSMVGWPVLAEAEPNDGHLALARLEHAGRIGRVITQNVDGLHQRAGTNSLIELHGNIHTVRCLACARRQSRAELQVRLLRDNPALADVLAQPLPDGDAQLEPESLEHFVVPDCEVCGGMLQPDVVFFGDNVPRDRTELALGWMDEADALLVVGSSLMVFSGFRFARLAAAAGKAIAAVNVGRTRADDLIGLKLALPAQQVLPQVARMLDGAEVA